MPAAPALTLPQIIDGARCFQSCIPPGMEFAVANYLLFLWATGGTPPAIEDLANEAICFFQCIPPGYQGAIAIYLIDLLNSLTPPVTGTGITTEGGDVITDQDGNILILE